MSLAQREQCQALGCDDPAEYRLWFTDPAETRYYCNDHAQKKQEADNCVGVENL